MIQQQRIEQAVGEILAAIGEDPNRPGLQDTPSRVANMYRELFSGIGVDPIEAIDTVFEEETSDPVLLRDVSFYSICEHHLLPFFGKAHLAYIPNGKIAGISKLARALELAAHQPQVQERLTGQVADAIYSALNPKGVAVEVEAEHLCMAMRGVQKPGSRVVTTAMRGKFENSELNREALLALLRRG
ncbi:MAG: GTP cyclohydrolase I FolE [Dehalococcoidia bacterium]